jgi:7 transmembrane receptor (rhodopsin family)
LTVAVSQRRLLAETRLAITFELIVASYIICWTPLVAVFAISSIYPEMDNSNRSFHVFKTFASWLTHFNSAINPFIYAYRIQTVSDVMKKIFMIKMRIRQQVSKA